MYNPTLHIRPELIPAAWIRIDSESATGPVARFGGRPVHLDALAAYVAEHGHTIRLATIWREGSTVIPAHTITISTLTDDYRNVHHVVVDSDRPEHLYLTTSHDDAVATGIRWAGCLARGWDVAAHPLIRAHAYRPLDLWIDEAA